jgi:hypothetical protein
MKGVNSELDSAQPSPSGQRREPKSRKKELILWRDFAYPDNSFNEQAILN